MEKKYLSINLLDEDIFSSSLLGKILTWALSIGRYIVVFTELIVILSFLSRFKLDRDLTDLNTEIVKQTAVIESYGTLEEEVRNIQSRLEIVREKIDRVNPQLVLNNVTSVLPPDVKLDQIQIDETSLRVSAIALSNRGMGVFIAGLKSVPGFDQLSIENIESDTQEGEIVFELQAEISASELVL